jgi:hypothetical protein
MRSSERIKRIIENPNLMIVKIIWLLKGYFSTDETYLKLVYFFALKRRLYLEKPVTYTEKIQWLKLYDRRPEYTKMVDKYEAKSYVANLIGDKYIIPTLGVWNNFSDIDFGSLPNQFVLKTTHDSGGVVICSDKSSFDLKKARKKINKSLKKDFYLLTREYPYKNIKPRIIAEKYMVDETGDELKDYKIFNFDGKPKLIQVDFGRFTKHKRNLYSINWNFIDATIQYPNDPNYKIEKPKELDKMLELARTLSQNIPHVRTDFYSIADRIYFGELTFYHGSGYERFTPESLNVELGECLVLPNRE